MKKMRKSSLGGYKKGVAVKLVAAAGVAAAGAGLAIGAGADGWVAIWGVWGMVILVGVLGVVNFGRTLVDKGLMKAKYVWKNDEGRRSAQLRATKWMVPAQTVALGVLLIAGWVGGVVFDSKHEELRSSVRQSMIQAFAEVDADFEASGKDCYLWAGDYYDYRAGERDDWGECLARTTEEGRAWEIADYVVDTRAELIGVATWVVAGVLGASGVIYLASYVVSLARLGLAGSLWELLVWRKK
jgi:hypothetical protein